MSDQTNGPPKINDPHDVRLRELLGNADAFKSFLKDCVKAEWVDSLDWGSLRKSGTKFILQDFSKKEADVVYEATLNNGRQKVIFYVHVEIQSGVDYRMPYRMLLYMVEILRNYYNNADKNERAQKDFKFPAVIPIVFYSGSQQWTVSTNLREMFDGHERFGSSLVNFNYALVDAKGYDDESVKGFQSRLLRVMMMFEKAESAAELIEAIGKYESDIKHFNEEELRIFNAAIDILKTLYGPGEEYKLDEIQRQINEKEVTGMLSNLIANERVRERQIREQERRRGIEQGIELEKTETAKALLRMGLTAEQVSRGTRLTIEEVKKIKELIS